MSSFGDAKYDRRRTRSACALKNLTSLHMERSNVTDND